MAAKNGHLEICRLILANVNDKNPVNHDGETPSQLAAYHGHLPVMELIKSALSKKGLMKKAQNVPAMMAIHGLGSGPATATTLGGRRRAEQSSTTPSTPATPGTPRNATILVESTPNVVHTETVSSSSSSDSSDSKSDSDSSLSVSSTGTVEGNGYYAGHGSLRRGNCYKCGHRGHWAPGCPFG